jgi:hypothetical protein
MTSWNWTAISATPQKRRLPEAEVWQDLPPPDGPGAHGDWLIRVPAGVEYPADPDKTHLSAA